MAYRENFGMFAALKGLPPRNHSTIAINLLVKRVLLASVSLHFLEKSFLKFSRTAFPLNQLGVIAMDDFLFCRFEKKQSDFLEG